jgi:sodium-coupled neutral amino acid transporter 11
VLLCGLTDWTVRLIATNAKLSGRAAYVDVMGHCFGASGRAAVSAFQFAFAFGGMCAFGIIIGDTIPQVLRTAFPRLQGVPVAALLANRQFVIAACTLGVSLPLSLYRDIHKLSRASALALAGMLVIVGAVLFEAPRVAPELRGDPAQRYTLVGDGVFAAVGVISFAFVCHHNSLLIYGSLRTPTLDRFAAVTHASTALALAACTLLAVPAYAVFTDRTQGNILNNFEPVRRPAWKEAGADRGATGRYADQRGPVLLRAEHVHDAPARAVRVPGGDRAVLLCARGVQPAAAPLLHRRHPRLRHVRCALPLPSMHAYADAGPVSLVTCDLGVMLEITGGVSASALAFVFPAICHLALLDRAAPWYGRKKLPAVCCATFGAVVLLVSLLLAAQKAWSPDAGAKICV